MADVYASPVPLGWSPVSVLPTTAPGHSSCFSDRGSGPQSPLWVFLHPHLLEFEEHCVASPYLHPGADGLQGCSLRPGFILFIRPAQSVVHLPGSLLEMQNLRLYQELLDHKLWGSDHTAWVYPGWNNAPPGVLMHSQNQESLPHLIPS